MKNNIFLGSLLIATSMLKTDAHIPGQAITENITKSVATKIDLEAFTDIPNDDALDHETVRYPRIDSEKKLIDGDLLFIKDKGTICGNLNVGKNITVGNQVCFNKLGCTKLLAKGAHEKNLLNLRSTFCFVCDPGLTCTFDHECGDGSEPAFGCLDNLLDAKLCQNGIEICSGSGLLAEKAEAFVSGTTCLNRPTRVFDQDGNRFLEVITDVQIEICIPISFCFTFCDRPTVHVTYDDNSSKINSSICVSNEMITGETENPNCVFEGHSITSLLAITAYIQKISRSSAWIKFKLLYQNCIGAQTNRTACVDALQQKACEEQIKAIQAICKHANKILRNACFDVIVEGRVQ